MSIKADRHRDYESAGRERIPEPMRAQADVMGR